MCFSQPISLFFTVLGFALGQLYRYKNRTWKDPEFWRVILSIDYFTSMEALQCIQYFWIDECDNPINKALSWVGFLHICFQPLVLNLGISWRVSRHNRYVVDTVIVPLCMIAGVFFSSRMFLADEFPCPVGLDPLCATDTCTYMGSIHLTWRFKMRASNLWTPGAWSHHFLMFAPAILTGNPLTSLFLFITGPIMGHYVTNWDLSEWASIWCYFSVLQVMCSLGIAHMVLWDKRMPVQTLSEKRKEVVRLIKRFENRLTDLRTEQVAYEQAWKTSWENDSREKVQ